MLELSFAQVKKHMGTTLILDDINFAVYETDKVGIVGANGTGKTTILKMIAGLEPLNKYPGSWSPGYDYGWINRTPGSTVAYLDQIPEYDRHVTVLDVLNMAFEEVFALEEKMRHLEDLMASQEGADLDKTLKTYSRTLELYELKGGYEVKEKLGKVCTGLQLTEDFLNTPFHLLSGGEKTTAVLGKLLIDQPDILLLDEPTNHLDTDAIEWLEGYLSTYKGIVMIVSHDRYFLDQTVTKIIELEDLGAKLYKGNYSSFVEQKEEAMRIQFADFQEQKKQIQAMERKIRQLREWALKADNNKFFQRAASIQIKLNKMKRIERPKFERPNMRLDLSKGSRSGREVIMADQVTKGFEGRMLLNQADLHVQYGERVALVGPNGCGKSTLLKMLLGEQRPDKGSIELGASVKVAYLPQRITFDNEDLTVLECLRDKIIIEEGKGREYLAKYMFYGKQVFTPVKGLSGGERIRLKLALLLYEDVNVLILDEPTNHLDILSIETLESALEDFKGTLFFVSHDRYFIDKMGQRIVAMEDQDLVDHDGNFGQYRATVLARRLAEEEARHAAKEKQARAHRKADVKKKDKEVRIDLEKVEATIEGLEEDLAHLEDQMLTQGDDLTKLNDLFEEKTRMEEALEAAYGQWELAQ